MAGPGGRCARYIEGEKCNNIKYTVVRVQDTLMYFMKAIGTFSTDTVRGLIYMYARGFITITRVSHPLQ